MCGDENRVTRHNHNCSPWTLGNEYIYFTDSVNYIGSVDKEDAKKGQHIETNEACGDDNGEDKLQPGIS